MSTRRKLPTLIGIALFAFSLTISDALSAVQNLEDLVNSPQSSYSIEPASQQLELPTGTSRSVKFDYKIPELLVDNPDVIRAVPISANEIIISGLKPGMANLTVTDPDKNKTIVAINVTMDVRKLEMTLANAFKNSSITVRPLHNGIMLCGTVARADDVEIVMAVAKDYVPTTVINRLQVDGSQVVATEVKIYEVSRTKLRNMGVDWSILGDNVNIVSGFADVITSLSNTTNTQSNFRFGVIDNTDSFDLFINMLEKRNLAKLMAQPTLVAQNGRPAEFLSGGEIPYQVSSGFGNNSIQFRPFGTKLDLVPIIHGQGELTLEVRAEVSEIANDLSSGTNVPGFRVRRVNTGVPMRAGQTLALAGDYREKVESEVKGAPGFLNKAAWGAAFRNTKSEENETELVFVMTPKFINAVDPSQLPNSMPGQNSGVPSNRELFLNGHIEVPRCPGDNCPTVSPFSVGAPVTGLEMPTAPAAPAAPVPEAKPTASNFGYPSTKANPVGFERDQTTTESEFQSQSIPNANDQGYFKQPTRTMSQPNRLGFPATASSTNRTTVKAGNNSGGVQR